MHHFSRYNLSFEEGLVTAVIALAANDASKAEHRNDALEYFQSETYKTHLQFLGLPDDFLPEGLVGVAANV
jgi:hypothetical protein